MAPCTSPEITGAFTSDRGILFTFSFFLLVCPSLAGDTPFCCPSPLDGPFPTGDCDKFPNR